jgi:hypothetical protein
MYKNERIYGILIHDRLVETDPHVATVMYSTNGPEGPWHDICTCDTDWAWEVLDAFQFERHHKCDENSIKTDTFLTSNASVMLQDSELLNGE